MTDDIATLTSERDALRQRVNRLETQLYFVTRDSRVWELRARLLASREASGSDERPRHYEAELAEWNAPATFDQDDLTQYADGRKRSPTRVQYVVRSQATPVEEHE